jgi:hypothetical protein
MDILIVHNIIDQMSGDILSGDRSFEQIQLILWKIQNFREIAMHLYAEIIPAQSYT